MIVGDAYTPPLPLLSVYASVAIPMIENRPYDWHWRHILRDLDAKALFSLSLRSHEMLKVVLAYVHKTRPAEGNADEGAQHPAIALFG
ncbi:hypothetical protein B0H13DRAFT_2385880 [Mycena leptocephala]|nr:hypothetical protein B0H13DRAFT_2385880 [Mycena leptocephala]